MRWYVVVIGVGVVGSVIVIEVICVGMWVMIVDLEIFGFLYVISYGNVGWFFMYLVILFVLFGVWCKVLGWLVDLFGLLVVCWCYFLKVLLWLLWYLVLGWMELCVLCMVNVL